MNRLTFQDSFWRDDSGLVNDDGDFPDPVQDLLDVAVQAYLADRATPRGPVGTPGWSRQLPLVLSVRQPDVWNQPVVVSCLTEVLNWLTGDSWELSVSHRRGQRQPRQSRLAIDPVVDDVALFSGGLDATAGVALRMAENRSILAVGIATNLTMRGYQRRTYRLLSRAPIGSVRYVQVPLESRRGTRHDEPTRRTRGLIFLAVGIAAAIAAGRTEVLMLENGIGAINLPYTDAQWGAMTSRSAHPLTLELVQRLARLTLDIEVRITNPHIAQTKGEMCEALPEWSREAVASSESCDNAAAGRGVLDRRCGECTSCLLRRVSLHAAGRSDWDARPYRASIRGPRDDRDRTVEMLWQAATLDRALRQSSRLLDHIPELGPVPSGVCSQSTLQHLYRTYVEEWRNYPDPRVDRFLGQLPSGVAP